MDRLGSYPPCKCPVFLYHTVLNQGGGAQPLDIAACIEGLMVPVQRYICTISKISVRASKSELRHNLNKWIDVSCLHWSESVSKIFVSGVRVQARRRYMLRFPRTRTSEFVRGCAMHMLKAACSHGRYCRVPKMAMTSDPIMHSSLGCSVNTILSGAWTRTRARMLGQCKGQCALICLLMTYLATCCHCSGRHGRQHEHKQINIMKVQLNFAKCLKRYIHCRWISLLAIAFILETAMVIWRKNMVYM